MGSLFLLQRIFLTKELNWGLLHCRQILYQLSHQGSPDTLLLLLTLILSFYFNLTLIFKNLFILIGGELPYNIVVVFAIHLIFVLCCLCLVMLALHLF